MTEAPDNLQPAAILQRTAWLRQIARQLAADSHGAEDVAQDTWVLALQHRGRIAAFGPWLGRVARRLAIRSRRREAERPSREARAARSEAEPSAADSVAWAQLQHRLVAAVLELPEPYRQTVLLRFFEELQPREIAARMDTPVETVRTRLRRALERLRGDLDSSCGGRGAWTALAMLRHAPAVATPALAATITALAMKAKLVLALAVLSITAGLVFLPTWSPAPDAPGDDTITAASPDSHVARLAAVDGSSTPDASDVQARSIDTPSVRQPVALPDDDAIVLRGRCVIAGTVAPISGVELRLDARTSLRLSARTRAVPFEVPPPVHTGADGRFELRFPHAPSWSLRLMLAGEGIVPAATSSRQLAAGTTIDYGDVEVMRGCTVHGRLVDTDGRAVAGAQLWLGREPRRGSGDIGKPSPPPPDALHHLEREETGSCRTAVDGSFRFDTPLAPGAWVVSFVERRRTLETPEFVIASGAIDHWLYLRTELAIASIAGIVVDDENTPIADAHLSFDNGEEWRSRTDAEGRFESGRFARDPDDPVRIRASERYHESVEPQAYAWGQTDVRIVLPRGASIELAVTDAVTGLPVEEYGVRVFQLPEHGNATLNDTLLRHLGHHPGGICRIDGLKRASNVVMVEPQRADLELSWFIPIDVTAGGTQRVAIALEAPVEREFLVVDGMGRPVAGSRVELVRSATNTAITPDAELFRRDRLSTLWQGGAVLLDETTSDADGRGMLRAAPLSGAAVRVIGGTHETTIVEPVEIRAGLPPLRVEVRAAATVELRFSPLSFVSELEPKIRLIGLDEPERRHPVDGRDVEVAADGLAVLEAVPPGSWEIELRAAGRFPVRLQRIENLVPGETRRVAIAASSLRSGILRGRVLLDGVPMRTRVAASSESKLAGTSTRPAYGVTDTDELGEFELRAPAGRYRLIAGWSSEPEFLSTETFELTSGAETFQEFRLHRQSATVRLLDTDGTPLGATPIFVLWNDLRWPVHGRSTDETGTVTIDPAPPGPFQVAIWPPELRTRDAQDQHRREHPIDWSDAWIRMGPVTPGASADPVVLRVPER